LENSRRKAEVNPIGCLLSNGVNSIRKGGEGYGSFIETSNKGE